MIDRQYCNRRATCGCQTHDHGAVRLKVIAPVIEARIVKPRNSARTGIQSGDIRSLMSIAETTCEGDVGQIIAPAMLLRDNVIKSERQSAKLLRQTSILAGVARA